MKYLRNRMIFYISFAFFLLLTSGCRTAHAEDVEQLSPLYADRYYYGLHIYGVSLTQTAEDTVCYRATITNHSGSYVPLKKWWLCFYDKYANLTFMVPGDFGDIDSGYTQILTMYKDYLTPDEVKRCLNETYSYRFFGRGTDEVDSFVNPNIVDFPEGTVLNPSAENVYPSPQNTATPTYTENEDQPLPLYADRYYYGLHIYGVSLTQTAEDTVCYRATITNHSGSYVPPKDWWLCFYDKYANLTFMVPGGFGDIDSGYSQTLVMYKNYLTPDEVKRCLNDTYTYRFFGQGTDEVDSFVNPNIVDFPEGTVLTPPTGVVNPTPQNTATPSPTHTATASPAIQDTATPLPTHIATASPTPQNTATPLPTHTGTVSSAPRTTAKPSYPIPAKAFSIKSLRVKQTTSYQFSCKLRWKKHPDADAYAIYRSSGKKGSYQMLAKDWKKTFYSDNKIKAGKTYYYQVIPYKNGQALESCLSAALKQQKNKAKKIKISSLKPPSASFSKRKTVTGQRYIEIRLKRYQGNILQIYIKKNHTYQKLSLKNPNLQKRKQKFRILYQQGGVTLYFKLRTYQKTAGIKKYSLYSKEYKIKL